VFIVLGLALAVNRTISAGNISPGTVSVRRQRPTEWYYFQ